MQQHYDSNANFNLAMPELHCPLLHLKYLSDVAIAACILWWLNLIFICSSGSHWIPCSGQCSFAICIVSQKHTKGLDLMLKLFDRNLLLLCALFISRIFNLINRDQLPRLEPMITHYDLIAIKVTTPSCLGVLSRLLITC